MSQSHIGSFIQTTRKMKNMTQKDLAEQIGVSDKTISKWENGNSVPDTEILMSLCGALDLTINELLAGEKLPPEQYSMKAEENVMNLLKEKDTMKKQSSFSSVIGAIVAVIAILTVMTPAIGTHPNMLAWYIDLQSFLAIVLICAAIVLFSGVHGVKDILITIQKIVIPVGVLVSLFPLTVVLGSLDDLSTLGPKLAITLLPLLYALVIYLIIYPIAKRLQ